MASYHVYFSAKKGVSPEALIEQVQEFMKSRVGGNYVEAWRILRMTNKAGFESLPDYHLIVDYPSEEDLQKGFRAMKQHYRDEPHNSLMTMVSGFQVAFSVDMGRGK